MLEKNQIFIHVPKTGGTTLNCTLHGTDKPQHASFNYRHIVFDTKLSNSGDIFNPMKNEKYLDYKIFMILRHPVDRILSEYYYFKESDRFFSMLNPKPKSFKEYALHRQTSNYVVSFLLGNQIFTKNRPSKEDLAMVVNNIESLGITIGIFEQFNKSLNLFEQEVGVKWPKEIENKRVTIMRPKKEEVSSALAKQIEQHHALDLELYEFALARFEQYGNIAEKKIKYQSNRFEFVLKYVNNHFLLDLVLKDHAFIVKNQQYFNELRRFLLTSKFETGEKYLNVWKHSFVQALKENKENKHLTAFIAKNEKKTALDFIEAFGRFIQNSKPKEWEKVKLQFSRNHLPKQNLWTSLQSWFKK